LSFKLSKPVFFPTTANEILKYINQLDHKKTVGIHELPVKEMHWNGRRHCIVSLVITAVWVFILPPRRQQQKAWW